MERQACTVLVTTGLMSGRGGGGGQHGMVRAASSSNEQYLPRSAKVNSGVVGSKEGFSKVMPSRTFGRRVGVRL